MTDLICNRDGQRCGFENCPHRVAHVKELECTATPCERVAEAECVPVDGEDKTEELEQGDDKMFDLLRAIEESNVEITLAEDKYAEAKGVYKDSQINLYASKIQEYVVEYTGATDTQTINNAIVWMLKELVAELER